MNEIARQLRQVGLFADLSDGDLQRICRDVGEVVLAAGEVLFAEGEPGDRAYVIVDGTVEILKATSGREALVAVRGPGEVIGEMALLEAEPRSATVRARSAAELLAVPGAALDELLVSSPSAARAMIRTLLARMRETSDRLRHSERMAQLGTLTAGVAHELNNPAAAIRRATERLQDRFEAYTELAVTPPPDGGVARERASAVAAVLPGTARDLDALVRSDTEAAVEDWLGGRGVEEAWKLAPELVDAGVDATVLDRLGADVSGPALADAVRFLAASNVVHGLVADIAAAAGRLTGIVGSLRSYAYLDRAPVQDVDVVQGLEDTLTLLGHQLAGVRVRREFDPDLPRITAHGSELNQVWTNLIANACDAVAEVDDRPPTLTLRARPAGDDVVVEVEDNGPGIPSELRPRIFDTFVTTKPPGKGTGLGLPISYRIVALEHRGELTVDSEPGRTIFRVVLPVRPDATETDERGGSP